MRLREFMKDIYGKNFYVHTGLMSVLVFSSTAALFFVTYYLGQIIDAVRAGYQQTVQYFWVIVIALFFSVVGTALSVLFSGRMTGYFAYRLRQKIGKKICMIQYQQLEQLEDGELLIMANKDIDGLRNWFSILLKLGCLPVQFGMVTIFSYRYNWKFVLFLICLIPLAAIPEALLANRLHKYHTNEKAAYSGMLSFFSATVESILVLKSFCLEELFGQKNESVLSGYKKERMKRVLHEQIVDIYSRCYGHITNVLILIIGAFFILNSEMSLGMLTSVILLANFVGEGIKVLNEIPVGLQSAKASLLHMMPLLEMEDEKEEGDVEQDWNRIDEKYVFDVRSLSFQYGDRAVLRDVSFNIEKGDKIAIVGPSGCGKTTLFKVLSGLYPPERDQVFFQGKDITELPPQYLRDRIAATTQETFLFQATFGENICMAGPNCEKEAMVKAAEHAKINEFIESLEKGYDTEVNTTVRMVSNGQMQRINLARAFLKDTAIFLLDEPTSALDVDTTAQVLDQLFHAYADRTILMILHDMRDISRFDKVLMLDNGEVAGFGTHTDLVAESEAYKRLYFSEIKKEQGK